MDGERGAEAAGGAQQVWAVLTRVGTRLCAVPLGHAVETMRLLPLSPVADAPPFVRGLAVIRGQAVPVVELAALFGEPAGAATRLLLVRVDERAAPAAVVVPVAAPAQAAVAVGVRAAVPARIVLAGLAAPGEAAAHGGRTPPSRRPAAWSADATAPAAPARGRATGAPASERPPTGAAAATGVAGTARTADGAAAERKADGAAAERTANGAAERAANGAATERTADDAAAEPMANGAAAERKADGAAAERKADGAAAEGTASGVVGAARTAGSAATEPTADGVAAERTANGAATERMANGAAERAADGAAERMADGAATERMADGAAAERKADGAAERAANGAAATERLVALAVDEVVGVVRLDAATLGATPPLAEAGRAGLFAAMGTLDAQLLVVLRAAHLLPDEAWRQLGLATP